MSINHTKDSFEVAILQAMRAEVERIVDEEAAAAGERVMQRVRGQVAQLATVVLNQYNISRQRDELVITVKLPEAK